MNPTPLHYDSTTAPPTNHDPTPAEPDNPWAGALCAQTDPEAFFPEKGETPTTAKQICTTCPLQRQCLQYALTTGQDYGIWGGTTRNERRALIAAARARQQAA